MGGISSSEQRQEIHSNTQRKEQIQFPRCLQVLPKNFSQHFNNVMSLVKTTIAQQEHVDQLLNISKAEATGDTSMPPSVIKGLEILNNLQAGRYIHTIPVQDSVMELYTNIQEILRYHNIPPFDIDSPFIRENYKQNWNRSTVLREGCDEATGRLTHAVQNDMQQREIARLNETIAKGQKYILELKQSSKENRNEIARLKQLVEQIRRDNSEQTCYAEKLSEEKESLERELEKLRPQKISATIQLFHSHSGNTIKDIETELKAMLKKGLNDVSVIKCSQLKDVDPSKVLIVLSIIASRVGTDAANAIKSIENPVNTALVLFHIKESHALTKQASTSVLTEQTFKALGGIFDMAFVNGKGIYPCEMNDTALDGVCTFVKQNMSSKSV